MAFRGQGAALWRAARALTTPLLPDDYLAMLNPLWTRQPRGRIVAVTRETPDMTTLRISPNVAWPAHRPGQYLRLGVELDGRRHWRAYTLTSDPGEPTLAVTVKRYAPGVLSPHLVDHARPGDLVHLGEVEGTFVLPQRTPERPLLISLGSGITPIRALLRELHRRDALAGAVHVHGIRTPADEAFATDLAALERRGLRRHVHHSVARGRLSPTDLDALCPDWPQRTAYACGPGPLLDALEAHYAAAGLTDRLAVERFQPLIGAGVAPGRGGEVEFRLSGVTAQCDGSTPMLRAGLAAGARLPHGCEIGICRTCVGALVDGQVRDLRTGAVISEPQSMVRTCVSCPEGAVSIDL